MYGQTQREDADENDANCADCRNTANTAPTAIAIGVVTDFGRIDAAISEKRPSTMPRKSPSPSQPRCDKTDGDDRFPARADLV